MVLRALALQTMPATDFEVVVVDDGSTDGTSAQLAATASSYPYVLRLVRQENGGPARARNHGIREARGELVLFLDDDVEPTTELLAEHLRAHDAESNPVVVIGTLSSLSHYAQPWVAWEQAKIEAQYQAMIAGVFEPTFRQFWTGNASIGRYHLLETGGFNTEFLRGEDVELGSRLHERGLKFRFNPRAKGLHHAERSLESWSNAHRSYGQLEVEIFALFAQEHLLSTLAGNFNRLHVGTRWLLKVCLGRPRAARLAERSLKGWLGSSVAGRSPAVSSRVCSLLANLLYWQASADAMGAARFEELLRRVQQLDDGGSKS